MSRRIWFAAGIILGLLVLTRENALILGIPVLYWILAVSFPGEWRKRLVAVGMFVGGCALVLFPVGLRNLAVGGEFHLTTSQFGPNFYIGNHAGADGTYQPLVAGHGSAADEREDSTRLAEQAAGHKLSPAEVSDFWTKRALDYIRSQPGAWLKLTARKLMLTFNAAELPDSESLEIYADTSWVLRLLNPFNFGVLLGLTVLCAMLVPGSWKRAGFLYVLIGIYALSVTLFYVFSRYRFPLVPMMMVLAAGGVAEMVTRLRQRRTQGLAVPVIAAVIAVLISHIPLHDSRGGWATHYTNFGNALARDTNRLEQAIGLYQRALDQLPQFPGAQYGIGLLLSRLNREGEAIPYYRAALASWPTFMEAHRALGKSLEAVGQSQEAAKELVEALRLSPDDALAHFAFAKTLASLNQLDLAVEHYKKGLSIQPKEVRGIVGLGVVFSQMGRSDEAIRNFQLALELIPQDTEALNNLGAVLANQGRLSEAIAYFERALSLDPKNEAAKKNLDMLRQSRPR